MTKGGRNHALNARRARPAFDQTKDSIGLADPALRAIDPTDPALHHIVAILAGLKRKTPLTPELVRHAVQVGREWHENTDGEPLPGRVLLMRLEEAEVEYEVSERTIRRWIQDERMCSYGDRPMLVNGNEVQQLKALVFGKPGR
jgi:hypothetical protein